MIANKKFIFVTGAPGSKWSSVVKNIYLNSQSFDKADSDPSREYHHDASGTLDLMHVGAYWDPGMEFGNWFDQLDQHSVSECEAEFNRPFVENSERQQANATARYRIIKSHVFAHHIDFLRKNWPDSPIVLVHRPNDACLGWWVKCGHFDITYPRYDSYYKNLRTMADIIKKQNHGIVNTTLAYPGRTPYDNRELCELLGLAPPPAEYSQVYELADVKVVVI